MLLISSRSLTNLNFKPVKKSRHSRSKSMEFLSKFYMEKNKDKDFFNILRKIYNKPHYSQRDIASDLGLSLGKINYCLKELKKKGLVKINNFRKNKEKINYIYLLTPKGIALKTKTTINFMKLKMKEYDELSKEIKMDKKNL